LEVRILAEVGLYLKKNRKNIGRFTTVQGRSLHTIISVGDLMLLGMQDFNFAQISPKFAKFSQISRKFAQILPNKIS